MPQSIRYQHWANLWAWTLTLRPPHHSSRVDVPFLCLCLYVILSQCHTFIMSGNMCCRQEHLWLICNMFQGPFSIYGRTHHNSNIVPWQILRPRTHYYHKNCIYYQLLTCWKAPHNYFEIQALKPMWFQVFESRYELWILILGLR